MNELTAVVIGATGLTGTLLLEQLLTDNDFKTIRILVRKKVNISHPKLEQLVVDFDDINDYANKFGKGDVIFCCVGTTQKKVKNDKIAYEKVDYDIPVNAAKIGIQKKFKKFLLVSAIGAKEQSSNFYLSLKGKTENAIAAMPFESVAVFRPSLLLGKRNEHRFGEKMAQGIAEIFSFTFYGWLRKYHPVDAKHVANAMIQQSKSKDRGVHYFDFEGIMNLSEN
jgi:uncharacterized protein YbjT (DUF2867 family)